MALPDFTGQYIQDTYQRVLQKSGSGDIVDGTGSLFIPPNAISASYATSASYEINYETSSSYAETASLALSGDGIFSGSFSGSYIGDGSGLTGISAGTSLTQSLFVSPSGDDGTATVGDLHLPFQTILGATGSANIGDTIIVYPGTYTDNDNILKDGVNYYFYPGAIVEPTTATTFTLGGNSTYTYPVNVRGAGTFICNTPKFGPIALKAPSGHIEFDTAKATAIGDIGGAAYVNCVIVSHDYTADPDGVVNVKGKIINSGSTGGNAGVFNPGVGNVIFEGTITSLVGAMPGVWMSYSPNDPSDFRGYGDVYSEAGTGFHTTARVSHCSWKGTIETGDQTNFFAVDIGNNTGHYLFEGEIIGAIRLAGGGQYNSGTVINGWQSCTASPNSYGAVQMSLSGINLLNQKITATDDIFYTDSGYTGTTYFTGEAAVTSNSTGALFKINGGTFIWNGIATDGEVRALSNTIAGGKLIINNYLEHWGSSYPSNNDCFALSGGTLEINDKVKYHHNTTGSGIINMTGGYLKLDGAQLIHNDGTGSYAYCIELNSGNYSGSIFNNSWTNLTPFGELGTFTNEAPGGGTLFYWDKLY